eukprot:TRINITY_DN14317_c0_g1_i1.p1 TRINITY_DN14317_c0_g1~~TRINITY_DN14317_c0_g1_i1.p1  ORF type:complete len:920 (+),score=54.65 TRINITY_DN14317_c0_g1_i1:74-2833(+)
MAMSADHIYQMWLRACLPAPRAPGDPPELGQGAGGGSDPSQRALSPPPRLPPPPPPQPGGGAQQSPRRGCSPLPAPRPASSSMPPPAAPSHIAASLGELLPPPRGRSCSSARADSAARPGAEHSLPRHAAAEYRGSEPRPAPAPHSASHGHLGAIPTAPGLGVSPRRLPRPAAPARGPSTTQPAAGPPEGLPAPLPAPVPVPGVFPRVPQRSATPGSPGRVAAPEGGGERAIPPAAGSASTAGALRGGGGLYRCATRAPWHNVRAHPELGSECVGRLHNGEVVVVTDWVVDMAGSLWARVAVGWALARAAGGSDTFLVPCDDADDTAPQSVHRAEALASSQGEPSKAQAPPRLLPSAVPAAPSATLAFERPSESPRRRSQSRSVAAPYYAVTDASIDATLDAARAARQEAEALLSRWRNPGTGAALSVRGNSPSSGSASQSCRPVLPQRQLAAAEFSREAPAPLPQPPRVEAAHESPQREHSWRRFASAPAPTAACWELPVVQPPPAVFPYFSVERPRNSQPAVGSPVAPTTSPSRIAAHSEVPEPPAPTASTPLPPAAEPIFHGPVYAGPLPDCPAGAAAQQRAGSSARNRPYPVTARPPAHRDEALAPPTVHNDEASVPPPVASPPAAAAAPEGAVSPPPPPREGPPPRPVSPPSPARGPGRIERPRWQRGRTVSAARAAPRSSSTGAAAPARGTKGPDRPGRAAAEASARGAQEADSKQKEPTARERRGAPGASARRSASAGAPARGPGAPLASSTRADAQATAAGSGAAPAPAAAAPRPASAAGRATAERAAQRQERQHTREATAQRSAPPARPRAPLPRRRPPAEVAAAPAAAPQPAAASPPAPAQTVPAPAAAPASPPAARARQRLPGPGRAAAGRAQNRMHRCSFSPPPPPVSGRQRAAKARTPRSAAVPAG